MKGRGEMKSLTFLCRLDKHLETTRTRCYCRGSMCTVLSINIEDHSKRENDRTKPYDDVCMSRSNQISQHPTKILSKSYLLSFFRCVNFQLGKSVVSCPFIIHITPISLQVVKHTQDTRPGLIFTCDTIQIAIPHMVIGTTGSIVLYLDKKMAPSTLNFASSLSI
jgi:hypothetical protein